MMYYFPSRLGRSCSILTFALAVESLSVESPLTSGILPTIQLPVLSEAIWKQNTLRHERAVQECEKLYPCQFTKEDYAKNAEPTEWERFSFPSSAIGEDECPRPPFGPDDLARISRRPLLTAEECALLIEEAEESHRSSSTTESWMRGGARFGTPDDRVGALLPLERLPRSFRWVNGELLPRLFSEIGGGGFAGLSDPSTLRLGGARIVRYDAAAGEVELGFHRDFLLLTANIALNDPHRDFNGGGTIVEAISSSTPIRMERGHALLHPGDVRHAAAPITSGKRYVLVLFLIDTTVIPHDRYLAEYGERAMMLASQEADPDGKNYLLSQAAELYSLAYQCGGRMDRGIFPFFYYRAGAAQASDV